MRQLLLILSFTLGLTTAASANAKDFAVGDVFYCDTIKAVGWVWNEEPQFRNYGPEKFKFSIVDKKIIKFGSEGSFKNYYMDIEFMFEDNLTTQDNVSTMHLKGSDFLYSSAHPFGGSFQVATCDRF